MFNLPAAKLGEVSAITITTPDLITSAACYKKLGFNEVLKADFPFPWVQISDGALLIMLRKATHPYLALTYYVKDLDTLVPELEADDIVFLQKPTPGDFLKKHIIESPDGLTVSLINIFDGFKQPPGPTMLTMNQQDYFNPEKYTNPAIGMFGELAHPVQELNNSIAFWQLLGFSVLSKFDTPYPWAIMSDGLSIVGLHQTKNFDYPAITYFAADMPEKLIRLRNEGGLEIKEMTGGNNAVLTTPEGQHFNLFKLGM